MLMECITTPKFSLTINGEMFGYFQGQRGLRQGDPLSPLIFTLCMEYLTRTIKYAAMRYPFHYHPMCKELKLANLMFADDILLFCKGDVQSIMTLLRAYSTFSKTSGLRINPSKSNAYFRGVNEDTKKHILSISGFTEGALPFKYLGMPIQTTRLTKHDYEGLVERICDRIHTYGARKFSYAGRLVLINAVLTSLHSYWATLFVLPKGILDRVETVCRNFLWDNNAEYRRVPLVAWNTICRPKEEGGLGIKNQRLCNMAMIGRLVHWVYEQKNSLWVKWVNGNYLKGQNWLDYMPGSQTSWVWRRICGVKQILLPGYSNGAWAQGYSPTEAYHWLRDKRQHVPWAKVIWNNWVSPKHQFVGWLFAHEALRTNDRLLQVGAQVEDNCYLCGQTTESIEHLFLVCMYSRKVRTAVQNRLGMSIPHGDILNWCLESQQRLDARAMTSMSLVYNIWIQRNQAKMELRILRPQLVAERIVWDIETNTRTRNIS
ncbi:hypothetical protein vseg_002079 [Gypsophila vaccaria]